MSCIDEIVDFAEFFSCTKTKKDGLKWRDGTGRSIKPFLSSRGALERTMSLNTPMYERCATYRYYDWCCHHHGCAPNPQSDMNRYHDEDIIRSLLAVSRPVLLKLRFINLCVISDVYYPPSREVVWRLL